MEPKNKIKICVVGLGYVGLPLATALAKHYSVIGFDINKDKIEELKKGYDRNNEVSKSLILNKNLKLTANPKVIKGCNFIIIAVPTPVDKAKHPDLTPVIKATIARLHYRFRINCLSRSNRGSLCTYFKKRKRPKL